MKKQIQTIKLIFPVFIIVILMLLKFNYKKDSIQAPIAPSYFISTDNEDFRTKQNTIDLVTGYLLDFYIVIVNTTFLNHFGKGILL